VLLDCTGVPSENLWETPGLVKEIVQRRSLVATEHERVYIIVSREVC